MSYLMKNLAVLPKNLGLDQTDVEELVQKAAQQYEVVPSRTGEYGLIYHGDDGDSTIHSKYDPLREATRIVDSAVDIAEADMIVVMGFGLGYHVEVLIQRLNKHQQIFIVEPSNGPGVLALDTRDLTNVLGNRQVHLLITDSPQSVGASFGDFYDVKRDSNVAYLFLAPLQKIYHDFFSKATHSLLDSVHSKKMEEHTLKAIGFDIIKSSVLNIGTYLSNPGIKETFGKFRNIPAFIIAAGPSLNKNVELLKQVKNKGVIIAVGTAVNTLQLHDIQPDIVVSLDPGIWNYNVFEKLNFTNTILVADLQINHKILDGFTGPKLMFSNPNNLIKEWFAPFYEDRDSFLLSGGSVANSACCLAYRMGCDPITFVGQDLCLSEDGHTHSVGSIYETSKVDGTDTIMVEGNDGGKVRTMHNWYRFLQWFEEFISSNGDRKYINATEGGARIQGTEILPLRQVITQYCNREVEIERELLDIVVHYHSNDLVRQKTISMFDEKVKEVGKIRRKIEKARSSLLTINRESGKMNRHLQDKLLKQIGVIHEYLNNSKEFFIIEQIEYTMVSDIMHKTHLGDRSEEDTFNLAAKDTIAYYETTIKACNQLEELLEQARQRMIGEE